VGDATGSDGPWGKAAPPSSPLTGDALPDYSDLSRWGSAPAPEPTPPGAPPPHPPAPASPGPAPARTDDRAQRRRPASLAVLLLLTVMVIGAVAAALLPAIVDEGSTEVVGVPGAELPDEVDGVETTGLDPGAPVDLRSDPTLARQALLEMGGDGLQLERLVVYPEYVVAWVRAPGDPQNIDRDTWFAGRGMSEPDPDRFVEADDTFIGLGAVPWDRFGAIVTMTREEFSDVPGVDVGYLLVDLDFDGNPGVSAYASNPERGGGGYARYALDGTLLRVVR
jgi:hypothetical protein